MATSTTGQREASGHLDGCCSLRGRTLLCWTLMAAAWYGVVAPKARLGGWMIRDQNNSPLAEAMAWLDGRLDLPQRGANPLLDRMHDTAYVAETGKVYSITPPLMTFFCYGVMAAERHWLGEATGVIGAMVFMPVVVLPLLLVGYWAFRTVTGSREWGAFLAFAFLATTANYPLLVWSRGGNAGYVNHLLSQVGLLLICGDLLGKRRMWPAAIGLLISVWSRQMTVFYALPMVWLAWIGGRRRWDVPIVAASLVLAVGVLMTLNTLKFGSPFETGYGLIYEGRGPGDLLASRARQGLFNVRWVPENLASMLWALPRFEFSGNGLAIRGCEASNSLVFSTPLVVLVFFAAAGWWRGDSRSSLMADSDRKTTLARRGLMLATVPVIVGILLYHAPGSLSEGCYRFGMDYLPVWLMAAAPWLAAPRWRWWTMGCVAWGLVYFQMLDFRPSV